MLTIKVKKHARHTKEYFKEHLDNGEYHAEKGKNVGRWYGKTSSMLGLSEGMTVDKDAFEALSDGKNPLTGKNLALRQKEKRRVCYDMVFSAPKSLSIMALIAQDDRLLQAHDYAIAVAFQELEKKAQSRMRKGLLRSSNQNRTTGNLISAHFTHRSSRALDPLLHTHCVVFNTTYDETEKRMKALQAENIYNSCTFLTSVYRNALASQVKQLGYEIEQARHGWRMRGVARDIETLFSKRKDQIEHLKEELKETTREINNNRVAHLALVSRAAKESDLRDSELLTLQLSQLSPLQIKTLQLVKQTAEIRTNNLPSEVDILGRNQANRAIHYALAHVFERKSVVEGDALLEAALNHSAGSATLEELRTELSSKDFIKRGTTYMTREERALEVKLLELVRRGKYSSEAWGDASNLQGLKSGQHRAATQILESKGQYFFLKGRAGTGKTFTLKEVIKNSNLTAILTAPTSSATDTLRQEVSEQALTIQKLLVDEKEQVKLKDAFLIVDEAGLLSTKQMLPLLLLAEKYRTKILFVGDTRQHNSVEGGDALRLIEEYSIIPTAEISVITRQKESQYRAAIQSLSEGKITKGFELLQAMGSVKEVSKKGLLDAEGERAKAVAIEYVEKTKDGITTLVVTPTWKEHERVTTAIREKMKAEGLLPKEDVNLLVFQSLNFTQIEKQYAPNYEAGHCLSFHSSRNGFKQGEIWKVVQSAESTVTVRNESGVSRQIDPSTFFRSFDVVEGIERPFSEGDLILLKSNYASSSINKLTNGTIQKIKNITKEGAIYLEGGKILDPKFRHFVHGYATTSQGSQGKTREHVILSADSSVDKALSKNHFYVSTSRGTQGVSIFTDNVERLKAAIDKSSNRELVIEKVTLNGIFRKKMEKLKNIFKIDQVQIYGKKLSRQKIEFAFRKFKDSNDSKSMREDRSRHTNKESLDKDS